MRTSKNILLVGPAGCGKTYLARNMAKNHRMLFVHMNENVTYENLVEGIQIETEQGNVQYSQKPQVILKFIEEIEDDKEYCLILDDINRVDLSAVLGELYFAFQNRDTEITLKSGRQICVPNNIFLIATMCTSDMHSINNNIESLFEDIRHIDNDSDRYVAALRNMKDDYNCTLSLSEFEDLVDQLRREYERYKNEYCVFTKEYAKDRREFELGYGYFLPSAHVSVAFWGDCIQNKIRHQVRPLLEQYAADGVIKREYIPDEKINDTKFVINPIKEDNIQIDKVPYYAKQEEDTFVNGLPLPYGKERNGGLQANPRYVTLSFLLQEMISHSLINQMDLFDMLISDEEILTFRNDIAAPNGRMGGRLFVKEDERSLFPVKDKKNPTLSPYSDAFHLFKYKGERYRLFSKYASSDSCPYKIDNCIETGTGSQNRILYKTVKMLVYKYLKKYKSNLENYLLNDEDPIIRSKLVQVTADIDFVSHITTEKKYSAEPYYINVNDVQDCIKLVDMIRSLPTWQMMLKEKGVYRKMSTDYMQIMNATDVRQMILQGPPGTSKTYGAKRFLAEMASIEDDDWEDELRKYQLRNSSKNEDEYDVPEEGKNMYWDIVQFHPSYTYEDFVRGITVYTKEKNEISGSVDGKDITLVEKDSIGYKSVNKAIGKMAKLANAYYSKAVKEGKIDECPNFYLVIDEINRANLATVFGELIFALEYRDKEINTPYKVDGNSELIIPRNMFIIGTMNTADKSIGTIDYAIRRRFLFFKLLPDINVVVKSIKKIDSGLEPVDCDEVELFYAVMKLFDECLNDIDYDMEDVQLGHTYFLRHEGTVSAEEQMKYRFIYQVLPILYEYKKDGILDFDRIKSIEEASLKEVLEKIRDLVLSKDEDRDSDYDELLNTIKASPTIRDSIQHFIGGDDKDDATDE